VQKGTAGAFRPFYDALESGETGTQEFKFQGWGWVLSSGSPFHIVALLMRFPTLTSLESLN
jgi:hypothetical protein